MVTGTAFFVLLTRAAGARIVATELGGRPYKGLNRVMMVVVVIVAAVRAMDVFRSSGSVGGGGSCGWGGGHGVILRVALGDGQEAV